MASKSDNQPVEGAVAPRNMYAQFHAYMLDRATSAASDGARAGEVMADQTQRILSAETADDIMRADMGGTIQARDVDGLEARLYDMQVVVSDREDITGGHGYYISSNATVLGGPEDMLTRNGIALGQDIVLQTGAELFATKVRALEAGGFLPADGVVTSIPTRSGNSVVKFLPLPKRVTSGTAE